MQNKSIRAIFLLAGALTLTTLACGFGSSEGPPRNAAVIDVTANTSLGAWLTDTAERFNEAEVETADGNQIYVQLNLIDSGEAIGEITDFNTNPALCSGHEIPLPNLSSSSRGVVLLCGLCATTLSAGILHFKRPVKQAWEKIPGKSIYLIKR